MKPSEFSVWYNRRYKTSDKRPYGVQERAAEDLGISITTLRHYLYRHAPISRQTARIVELIDQNDRLKNVTAGDSQEM